MLKFITILLLAYAVSGRNLDELFGMTAEEQAQTEIDNIIKNLRPGHTVAQELADYISRQQQSISNEEDFFENYSVKPDTPDTKELYDVLDRKRKVLAYMIKYTNTH